MDHAYGYCGMPCALCTRYRTEGKSRCPGCSADGYYTEPCKVHHCCRARGLAHCGLCAGFPCARLMNMGEFSDLRTHHVKEKTCAAVAAAGFEPWYAAYNERAELLGTALARYNNGRMKRFLCELFIQRDMAFLTELMRRAEGIGGDPKERGKAFMALVRAMDEEESRKREETFRLRPFEDGDMARFKRWLYAPHVAKWFKDAPDWLDEAEKRHGDFCWISHFIVEYEGAPIGFCQYYEYCKSGEDWHGDIETEGAYSIDYLIGEPAFLAKGLGKRTVEALMERIGRIEGAKRIILQPERDNRPSRETLRACGFRCADEEAATYIYEWPDGIRSV